MTATPTRACRRTSRSWAWGSSTSALPGRSLSFTCWVYNQNGYDVGRTTANGLWNKSQHISEAEAERYFRDLWLVVHSLSTLIVTGDCPYSDQEVGQILTGFSISICKAIKEVPGFAAGTFDRDAAFRALVGGDA
jgi:hypothetical protein